MSNLSQFLPIGSVTTEVEVGRVIEAVSSPGAKYLECNGGVLTQAGYPALFTVMGKNLVYDIMANNITAPFSTSNIQSIFWTGSRWLVGYSSASASPSISYSADGLSWTSSTSLSLGSATSTRGFAGGDSSGFVIQLGRSQGVISGITDTVIISSVDGITTRSVIATIVNKDMQGIAYNGGALVVVGLGGVISRSINAGGAWTTEISNTTMSLHAVTWAGGSIGLFVAVGDHGIIVTSPDGITWTVRAGGATLLEYPHMAVHYDSVRNLVVAGGGNGWLLTSTNGTTWTKLLQALPTNITAIASDAQGIIAFTNGMNTLSPISDIDHTGTAPTNGPDYSRSYSSSVDGLSWSFPDSLPLPGSREWGMMKFGGTQVATNNGTSIMTGGNHGLIHATGFNLPTTVIVESMTLDYNPSLEFILPNIPLRNAHTRFYIRAKP